MVTLCQLIDIIDTSNEYFNLTVFSKIVLE